MDDVVVPHFAYRTGGAPGSVEGEGEDDAVERKVGPPRQGNADGPRLVSVSAGLRDGNWGRLIPHVF